MARRSESAAEAERNDADVRLEVEEANAPAKPASLDLEFVKGLIDAVDASGIDSLEITRSGTRIKIAKSPPSAGLAPVYYGAGPAAAPAPPPPAAAPSAAPTAPAASAEENAPAEPASEEDSGLIEITSPMVGTFYRAPAPDAPPYVEEGTRVQQGQTLCILEAMKLMNELESEAEGVIREILVENAEPVEYGQVLFRVDPNG